MGDIEKELAKAYNEGREHAFRELLESLEIMEANKTPPEKQVEHSVAFLTRALSVCNWIHYKSWSEERDLD